MQHESTDCWCENCLVASDWAASCAAPPSYQIPDTKLAGPAAIKVPSINLSGYIFRGLLKHINVRKLLSSFDVERIRAVSAQLSLHQSLVHLLGYQVDHFDQAIRLAQRSPALISAITADQLRWINGLANDAKHAGWYCGKWLPKRSSVQG